MMPYISKEDREMSDRIDEWLYWSEDGWLHLKDDAPAEIKECYKRIQKAYSWFG